MYCYMNAQMRFYKKTAIMQLLSKQVCFRLSKTNNMHVPICTIILRNFRPKLNYILTNLKIKILLLLMNLRKNGRFN